MEIGAHIIVRGQVQGVGFRFFVHNWVHKLGLRGFVKNLYNGEVEIQVEGARSLIEELIREVKIGPRSAGVTGVQIDWRKADQHFINFNIL